MRVAMVCLGNICRSPMAAAVGRALMAEGGLDDHITVESFGTAGYHVGNGADSRAVAALKRRSWPTETHRARMITADDLDRLDLVLAADHANVRDLQRLATDDAQRAKICLLRSFDPATAPGHDEVPDPWFGGEAEFDHALDLIEAACRGLVEHLAPSPR